MASPRIGIGDGAAIHYPCYGCSRHFSEVFINKEHYAFCQSCFAKMQEQKPCSSEDVLKLQIDVVKIPIQFSQSSDALQTEFSQLPVGECVSKAKAYLEKMNLLYITREIGSRVLVKRSGSWWGYGIIEKSDQPDTLKVRLEAKSVKYVPIKDSLLIPSSLMIFIDSSQFSNSIADLDIFEKKFTQLQLKLSFGDWALSLRDHD